MYKGGKFFSNNDIYFVREKNLLNFYFYGNKMAIGKLEDRSKKYSDEDNEKSNVKNQIIVPVFEPPSPISIDRTSKKCAIFSCNKSKKESLKGNRVLKRKRKDRTDEAPPLKVRRKRNLQQGLVRESLSKEEKDEISKIRILKSSKDYMTVMSRNFNGNRRIEETLSLPYFSSVSNKENGNCSMLQKYLLLTLLAFLCRFTLTTDNGYVECPNGLDDVCKCSYNAVGSRIECPGTDPREIITRLKNNYIHVLIIENCNTAKILPPLPAGRIRSLELSHCNLEETTFGAFALLSSELKELHLNNNQFKKFPNLGVLPKLISLNLSNNSISHIEPNVFSGLKGIRSLRLKNNMLQNLSSTAFNDIRKSLNVIDLRGNKISNTSSFFRKNMTSLEYVDLSLNRLTNISEGEFSGCKNLVELRLFYNMIQNFSSKAFGNDTQLRKLYLGGNLLNATQISALKGFNQLELLDLSHNKIEKIPEFYGFPNVTTIKLEKNTIAEIKKANFKGCPNVNALFLDGNVINKVEDDSFIGLNNLTVLGLGDNLITKFTKQSLNGVKKLKKLNLRKNSLTEVSEGLLRNTLEISAIDLSSNDINKVPRKLFHRLPKLDYIDLSKNRITVIEAMSFDNKVSNILLTENPLHCDQTPIKSHEAKCVFPEKFVGKGLKEVVIMKANDTITRSLAPFNSPPGIVGANAFGSLFSPGTAGLPMMSQSVQGMPVVGALSRIIPGIKEATAKEDIWKTILGRKNKNTDQLNSAIEEFVNPITRIAGGDALPSDIESLVQAVPKMVVHAAEENAASSGKYFNISSLPPNVLEHLLNGGSIPGVEKDVMDELIRKNFNRIIVSIEKLRNGTATEEDVAKIIPSFEKLPSSIVKKFVAGEDFKFVDEYGMDLIRNYYLERLPIDFDELYGEDEEKKENYLFKTPFAKKMFKLLPKGYNISKISKSVLETIVSGGVPNFKDLPVDLQEHFKEHSSDLVRIFESENKSIDLLMSKLPNFDKSHLDRVETYDISKLSANVVNQKEYSSWKETVFYATLILLGIISFLAICYITYLTVRIYRGQYPPRKKDGIKPKNNQSALPRVVFTPNHHSTPVGVFSSARQRFSAERFERQ
uniref:LRRCT domain-containing protein n=1 Tax=Strongyloides stercoralis TaxID=6248 RepID=A0A0K0E994_STRER